MRGNERKKSRSVVLTEWGGLEPPGVVEVSLAEHRKRKRDRQTDRQRKIQRDRQRVRGNERKKSRSVVLTEWGGLEPPGVVEVSILVVGPLATNWLVSFCREGNTVT